MINKGYDKTQKGVFEGEQSSILLYGRVQIKIAQNFKNNALILAKIYHATTAATALQETARTDMNDLKQAGRIDITAKGNIINDVLEIDGGKATEKS